MPLRVARGCVDLAATRPCVRVPGVQRLQIPWLRFVYWFFLLMVTVVTVVYWFFLLMVTVVTDWLRLLLGITGYHVAHKTKKSGGYV